MQPVFGFDKQIMPFPRSLRSICLSLDRRVEPCVRYSMNTVWRNMTARENYGYDTDIYAVNTSYA